MSTTLYYFSATGNSLKFARDIAAELGDCKLVSMAHALKTRFVPPVSERVGFVFPVFAWGLPRMVGDFLELLALHDSTYVFAIATCVAIPGNTLKELEKRLRHRGAQLHAGFAVKAERSSLMKLNGLDRVIMLLDRKRKTIRTGEARLPDIAETIRRRELHTPETSSWSANLFGSLLHAPALNTFKNVDSDFTVQESCKGCGTCVQVCPRANIKLVSGRPSFEHNCEFCHACIQWCPSFAIRHPGFDVEPKQYRNPAVKVCDFSHSLVKDIAASSAPAVTQECRLAAHNPRTPFTRRNDKTAIASA